MRIREEESALFTGCRVLMLSEEHRRVASVHFLPRRMFFPAELTYIQVLTSKRNEGFGRHALQAFIERVGHGKVVTTQIVHGESWRKIRELGILRDAFGARSLNVMSASELSQIPITNFLQKSGMRVDRVVFVYGRGKREPTYDAVMEKIDIDDSYPSFFRSRIEGSV